MLNQSFAFFYLIPLVKTKPLHLSTGPTLLMQGKAYLRKKQNSIIQVGLHFLKGPYFKMHSA